MLVGPVRLEREVRWDIYVCDMWRDFKSKAAAAAAAARGQKASRSREVRVIRWWCKQRCSSAVPRVNNEYRLCVYPYVVVLLPTLEYKYYWRSSYATS